MKPPQRLITALFLLTSVVVAACGPETVRVTPAPTIPATTTAPPTETPTRTPTTTPPLLTPSQLPSPTPTPTTTPGGTPNTACTTLTGGSQANRAVITAVRVAHNPGFDRVVFELGPNAVGPYGLPPFAIEVANTFIAVSGQPVHVDGNAFFAVRLNNTDAHDQNGNVTVASTDIKATTPLVREVRIVEDFEAVNRWAIGLERLVCPTLLTLANPVRVVLDFPTPP